MAAGGTSRKDRLPNPLSGLSLVEVRMVQDQWEEVSKNRTALGVEVFVTLFSQHPDYKKLFPKLAKKTLEQLRTSKKVVEHGTMVMEAISDMVKQLQKPDAVLRLLRDKGRMHVKSNVTAEHFLNLRRVVMDVLEQRLKEKMDDKSTAAWSKTLDFVFSGLIVGVEEGMKKSK
ncbi:globin C, coelomic-like [Bacillus rossius redtenbacheri]|uniref:globin C, coelomic-like n=1 Tax=Bacillus rossius redtenbacheri TaxID=93214 RepID=UPI002FDD64E7